LSPGPPAGEDDDEVETVVGTAPPRMLDTARCGRVAPGVAMSDDELTDLGRVEAEGSAALKSSAALFSSYSFLISRWLLRTS
jgi:hypothetical protein